MKDRVRKKWEIVLWGSLAAGLILLYLLSSTDWIIKEKEAEVYPVSIIIRDTSDDYYVNFRKGVDQAALEYNVDVSFITLYQRDDLEQQMELVRREGSDGAEAIILEPVDETGCRQYLEENSSTTPLILLGEAIPQDMVYGAVFVDWREAGRKLGEAIAEESSQEIPVWILAENPSNGVERMMKEGLMEVLEAHGISYEVVPRASEDTYRSLIEKTVYPGSGEAVIAALDGSSTAEAAEIISASSVYERYIAGLYGVGMTPALLDQLDKGTIKGLIVTNQFDAGYFAVKKAVQAIEKDADRSQLTLDSYYIERGDLHSGTYEKMLYPIE